MNHCYHDCAEAEAMVMPCVLVVGFTLVVSPLLSLMEDQVISLRALDIDAGMFHSQSSKEETNRLMQVFTQH